ncbi:6-O-methylguanine DNA methyltransferase [Lyophyllum atratum]|nr:6-O-methylguanine DNA methyltransferase [Lyophyllum atratum]
MPAIRIDKAAFSYQPLGNKAAHSTVRVILQTLDPEEKVDLVAASSKKSEIWYPNTPSERAAYRTSTGKAVTSHHWDVYDFTYTIPSGRVTTYKDVCIAVGGSPRSVGSALRNNPFAPYIPCHRVIASNFFVGGLVNGGRTIRPELAAIRS